ncbi:di-trans,poly-cis-decaprenylcistransferase [Candidatus Peribacteria bacterium RIFCSPHIGHO2_01_FULL_51_9]|nr:MAG: di-trans,poly-cis-decaprenylcistransferase [Candidatus Peribacteria bacterium RIFCSPHIGHO2_01_FULL_51_9]
MVKHTLKTPACIGIILDGNRRWARERNLPTFEGHRHGMANVEKIARAARDFGIKHMIVYGFSTENWNRSKDEVHYLMGIFESTIRENLKAMTTKEKTAVRFVGQRKRFPPSLQNAMREVEEQNPKNPRHTLWICLSYGSRAEIVDTVQRLSKKRQKITEKSLGTHLWTAGMPDPDLIIRTSGEQRLSNFLLWQGAYSELFFVKKHWPAFTRADLQKILREYAKRERRMGR